MSARTLFALVASVAVGVLACASGNDNGPGSGGSDLGSGGGKGGNDSTGTAMGTGGTAGGTGGSGGSLQSSSSSSSSASSSNSSSASSGTASTSSSSGTGGSSGVGSACSEPADVTTQTFPYTVTGQFNDDPAHGGSCNTAPPKNAVWLSYTAPAAGDYRFDLLNQSTTLAYSRVAIFGSSACSPLGAELACATSDSKAVTLHATLAQDQTALILFYTDGDAYTMVNPKIAITSFATGGNSCDSAIDVTSATFPYLAGGTFDADSPMGGTCDGTPTNPVWFSYTAPATDNYKITLTNQTTTNAYARMVVFDGSVCTPLGTELLCSEASGLTIHGNVPLTAGQTVKILFHTDGDAYTMVDPQITVAPVGPPAPGEVCSSASNVTAVTFPFTLTGDFDGDPAVGGSCDTTPTNAVWYAFTPAATATYTITATNATTTFAYSRLAVFSGAGCSPLGTELTCMLASDKTITTPVALTAGQPYLILFHTDGDTYTMINPTLNITHP